MALSFLLAAVGTSVACGTEAVGTDSCRKIEQARCRRAPVCPALGIQGDTAVEQCVMSARDRCLHGLAVADPGPAGVDPCVNAISSTTSCEILAAPEYAPACAFLRPTPLPEGGTDASDANTTDADQ